MEKISYNLVFNRKKNLNKRGMALIQVEAYLNKKKCISPLKSILNQTNGTTNGNGKEPS